MSQGRKGSEHRLTEEGKNQEIQDLLLLLLPQQHSRGLFQLDIGSTWQEAVCYLTGGDMSANKGIKKCSPRSDLAKYLYIWSNNKFLANVGRVNLKPQSSI